MKRMTGNFGWFWAFLKDEMRFESISLLPLLKPHCQMRVAELDEVDRPGQKNRRAFRLPRLAHQRGDERGKGQSRDAALPLFCLNELSNSFITPVMKSRM